MLALVILLYCTSKLVTATEQCDTYQFSHPFYPGESCKEIYDLNPQTHNRSGYYWLINPPRHVYCDMEQRVVCGNIGGWTRIASVNITRGDQCPTGWTKSSQDGISFCRSPSDNAGCYPVLFSSKGISYRKVCGMARGYQKGTPDAFRNGDTLSITHGNAHQHIWSYAVGLYDMGPYGPSCPCANNHGHIPPNSYIGSNYYCESGVNRGLDLDAYYLSDPLWDGLDCPTNNTCCDNPNLPWFYRELDMATMDDVEVRICTDQDFSDEAILVDQLTLYIQ
ncbi:uncharacterized protein [Dysidea avara]|uniref:uncharacterized protein n=1 Tax=Dysidea avara TaxID=196820 RepID=UPI003334179B